MFTESFNIGTTLDKISHVLFSSKVQFNRFQQTGTADGEIRERETHKLLHGNTYRSIVNCFPVTVFYSVKLNQNYIEFLTSNPMKTQYFLFENRKDIKYKISYAMYYAKQ